MVTYNFNHKDYVSISKFPNGSTQNIECKIGQKQYYMDIHKTTDGTWIELYRKTAKNRSDQSKYDTKSELHSVYVQNDAIVGRKFMEHIEEIENAVSVVRFWNNVLR